MKTERSSSNTFEALQSAKLINFYSPRNHQKNIEVLPTSRGNEFNEFAQIHLIMQAKFGNDPK